MEHEVKRGLAKSPYILGIVGVVITLLMAVGVIYYWEFVQRVEGYGYLGAFIISILGGATIIVPVPMMAVVFALGGVLRPYWVGIAAGLGETIGALIIYMMGHGGGAALSSSKHSKVQAFYSRIIKLLERRGSLTLFLLSAILNPFFYPVALAAGASRFEIRKYVFVIWTGKTIKGLTVAYAGYWGLRGLLRVLGMPV